MLEMPIKEQHPVVSIVALDDYIVLEEGLGVICWQDQLNMQLLQTKPRRTAYTLPCTECKPYGCCAVVDHVVMQPALNAAYQRKAPVKGPVCPSSHVGSGIPSEQRLVDDGAPIDNCGISEGWRATSAFRRRV